MPDDILDFFIAPHLLKLGVQTAQQTLVGGGCVEELLSAGQVVDDVAAHLGKKLTPDQKERLLAAVDIEAFRKNKAVNKENGEVPPPEVTGLTHRFIRKGIVGDWKNFFTPEMNAKWDPWIKNELKNSGLEIIFE